MNNILFIREGQIAFSKFPGSFRDESFIAHDLEGLLTDHGLFLPFSDFGMQVFYEMRHEYKGIFETSGMGHVVKGLKGVTAALSNGKAVYHLVHMRDTGEIAHHPLVCGPRGFAVLSPYDHLSEMGMMCVRLTDKIEDTVTMYCKHTMANRRHVEIWTHEQMADWLRLFWIPYIAKKLEDDKKAFGS